MRLTEALFYKWNKEQRKEVAKYCFDLSKGLVLTVLVGFFVPGVIEGRPGRLAVALTGIFVVLLFTVGFVLLKGVKNGSD